MKFALVSAVAAHTHNTCGVAPLEQVVVHFRDMFQCLDPKLTEEAIEECAALKAAAFERFGEKCIYCLGHYFDSHLPDDAKCWTVGMKEDEMEKCILHVAKALHDTCFIAKESENVIV